MELVCRTCGETQPRSAFRQRSFGTALRCESCRDLAWESRTWTPTDILRLRRAGSAAVRLWKHHGDDFTEAEHQVIRELIGALDREDLT